MVRLKDIPNYSANLPFVEGILSGLAKYFTWIFIHLPISGTQITLISMVFAMFGALLSAYGYFIIGFAFFCVFILLDHVDGQVARFNGESGRAGIYIDSRAHHIVEPLYFVGLGIGAFRDAYGFTCILYLIAGIACALFYLMRQTLKVEGLEGTKIRRLDSEQSLFGKINYIAFDFIRINNPFSLMMLAIMAGYVGYTLCVYATLFGFNVIYNFYKTYNDLKNTS